MPVLQAIADRRSIREYQPGAPVSDDQVRNMLTAAMMAPSAHNGRPWEFVVVRDRARLDALRKVHPYAGMLGTASMAVVMCMPIKAGEAADHGFIQLEMGYAAALSVVLLLIVFFVSRVANALFLERGE